jgi:2-iminobutanoate/2-iminopropanoate deaminase
MKKIIATDHVALPVGPYSQATKLGNLIFLAGQIPLDTAGNVVGNDIKTQTTQVIENIKHILAATEASLDTIVKATVFLTSLDNFQGMNEVYASYFTTNPPARTTVEILRLPKNVLVEIEVIAYRSN